MLETNVCGRKPCYFHINHYFATVRNNVCRMTHFVLDVIEPSPETHTYVFAERRLTTQAKSNSSIGPKLED